MIVRPGLSAATTPFSATVAVTLLVVIQFDWFVTSAVLVSVKVAFTESCVDVPERKVVLGQSRVTAVTIADAEGGVYFGEVLAGSAE